MIRIDCYLAKLKDFRTSFPKAHFEVVTRTAGSVLSPSRFLLDKAKNSQMPFEEYGMKLKYELLANPNALKLMESLKEISKYQDVFLVCFEKDPNVCHRSLLKKWIEEGITNV